MAEPKVEKSVRERLLDAADDLFYAEGVHTVGIDRVIERADVAKASLYAVFGSKEELVRAYLERRALRRRARITERIALHEHPRDKILSIFGLLEEMAADPGYRGCAFLNATAEGPPHESRPRAVCLDQREWVRGLFTTLASDAGARPPKVIGRRLQILYDGVAVGSGIERDPSIAAEAREMAAMLLPPVEPAPKRPARR